MPILPHNQRAIDGLQALGDERTTYRSIVVTGLVLEVMPSGKKSWRVRYRTRGGRKGKTRAYTIGDASLIKLGPAVDEARKTLLAVKLNGHDPVTEKYRQSGISFEALFNDWLERHAKLKKKSWYYDEAMFQRHIRRRLGQKVAADINRKEVVEALNDIARTASGIQANRAQTLISAVFNWAVNEKHLENTPTFRIPKRSAEVPRERVLTEAEIKALWGSLNTGLLSLALARIVGLALLTGQRRSEITEARKTEFELVSAEPTWTIPGTRTKNGVMHRVPLTEEAAVLFADATDDSSTEFVFPRRGSPSHAINPKSVTNAMLQLTTKLGIKNATFHDLRRTVGTNLARLGISKDIRARVLNHVDGAKSVTDAVYNQYEFVKEKRAALERWEEELARIVLPLVQKSAAEIQKPSPKLGK